MTLCLVYNLGKNQFIQADESCPIFIVRRQRAPPTYLELGRESPDAGQESRNTNIDISTKSVRMPTFGGKHKYFQVWWMQFTEYAAVYGFASSVRKTIDPDFPSGKDTVINLATTEGKKQEKSNNMNVIVITNITMDFTSESLTGMVYQARTTEWPSGLVHMVVDALFKKYVLQDLVSKIELRRALNSASTNKE